jgi:oxygen-dependent protoporphyrinogen oxidase
MPFGHLFLWCRDALLSAALLLLRLQKPRSGYMEKVVIIGAGISGLAVAYRLKRLGIPSLVLEASSRPGGVIATTRRKGFLFETGPQFPRFPAPLWQLVRELNLDGEFVAGNSAANRYILRHGQLHPAPFSPMGVIKTRLVGISSKLRILADPFGYSQPPDHEESLAEFIRRKFGPEILDNLVDPFISTVFLGDASKMGMESAFPALVEWERRKGSLLRGALSARKAQRNPSAQVAAAPRPSVRAGTRVGTNGNGNKLHVTEALPALGSFKSGMAILPEHLADELGRAVRYNITVAAIAPSRPSDASAISNWQISLSDGTSISTEHVVLAVPAHVASIFLARSAPEIASLLGGIEYAPICVVSSAYNRSAVRNTLDGFGFLVPRSEGLQTICTFWNSSLFSGRAPEGNVVITTFAGREGSSGVVDQARDAFVRAVDVENSQVLGISGAPLDREVSEDPRALPQYNVGHALRVKKISATLRSLPNLHLAGNYLSGRSIGECVDVANRVAEDLHSQLEVPVI